MKYLDRLINFIFSLVILVLSAIIILVATGFVEYDIVDNFIRNTIFSVENNTITCIVSIVVFLAALKTTMFLSKTSPKKKSSIMVDTTRGKIQIASETIENTAKNIVKNYDSVKDVQVKMVKEKRYVNVYMALLVLPHTNIIELSSKVQDEVKDAIQNTTGVKVNNVDIKIKNIADSKNKSTKTVKEEIVIPMQNVELPVIEENDEVKATDIQSENNNEQNVDEVNENNEGKNE